MPPRLRPDARAGGTSTPAAGEAAPDFTAQMTDSTGKTMTVSLSSLRGKVVVLAFYPLDRSQGCTAELKKFRDEYKTLFGDGVVVLPTSVDTPRRRTRAGRRTSISRSP